MKKYEQIKQNKQNNQKTQAPPPHTLKAVKSQGAGRKNRAFTFPEVLATSDTRGKTCSHSFFRASEARETSKIFNKLCAFTLAEVLITLAIIGVVAALTIPTVVKNYQKQQTVTQLKKVYSALSQTTNLAIADNGSIKGWELNSTSNGAIFSQKYLVPYLKVSKNCNGSNDYEPCNYNWVQRDGTEQKFKWMGNGKFYLNDGTYIHVKTNFGTGQWIFATIYLDLNGDRKPNILGKDIFRFQYSLISDWKVTGYFIALGIDYNLYNLKYRENYGCLVTGDMCAALIMKQGWQITDDYEW